LTGPEGVGLAAPDGDGEPGGTTGGEADAEPEGDGDPDDEGDPDDADGELDLVVGTTVVVPDLEVLVGSADGETVGVAEGPTIPGGGTEPVVVELLAVGGDTGDGGGGNVVGAGAVAGVSC
jgi:hypothetical protein